LRACSDAACRCRCLRILPIGSQSFAWHCGRARINVIPSQPLVQGRSTMTTITIGRSSFPWEHIALVEHFDMAANPRLRSRPPPGHQALFVTGAGLCARGWCSHAGTKSHPRDSVRAAAWISLQCDSRTDLERERSRRRMNSPDDCCHLGVARVPQRRSNRHYRGGQRRQVAPDRWGIVGVECDGCLHDRQLDDFGVRSRGAAVVCMPQGVPRGCRALSSAPSVLVGDAGEIGIMAFKSAPRRSRVVRAGP
jgi:hypothetical protein